MKSKRNASVELLRLFGILMILGYHNIQADLTIDVSYDFITNFWTNFYSDCVPMFFMITGFFLFNSKNTYNKVLKHLFTGILIPTIILFIAYFYLYDWIINGASLTESIHHTLGEYYITLRSLITFNSPWQYTNHTWYIFLYTIVMLLYPAMKGLVDYLDKDVKREKIFLLGSLLVFIINDIFSNDFMSFSFHTLGGVAPAFIMIIWGHIIYKHKDIFTGKRIYALYAFICLVACNFLRDRIVYFFFMTSGTMNTHVKNWYTSFGLINPVLMIILAFNIIDGFKDSKINKCILRLASINLPMYLLHQICIDFMTAKGIRTTSTTWVYSHFAGHTGDIMLILVNTTITFVLTVILVLVVRFVKTLIQKAFIKKTA